MIRYSSSDSGVAPTCATQISTSYGFCVSVKIAPSVWVYALASARPVTSRRS